MKIFLNLLSFIFVFAPLFAIKTGENLERLSFGIQFNVNASRLPYEFSIGANFNSPLLLNRIGFSLETHYGFLRGVRDSSFYGNEEFFNFMLYRFSIVLTPGAREDKVRPYLKLGMVFISGGKEILPDPPYNGIYISAGMNVMFAKWDRLAFFLELGSQGLFKEVILKPFRNDPVFENGIFISTGLKFFL